MVTLICLKHFVRTHRPRGRQGGSHQEGHLTAHSRQHVKRLAAFKYFGCVEMRKWDALTAAGTQHAPLSRGSAKTLRNWYEHPVLDTTPPRPQNAQNTALLSKLKPKSTESPTTPDAHCRDRSRARMSSQHSHCLLTSLQSVRTWQ